MAKPKKDAYQEITNEFIKALETGIVPWKKPWDVIGDLPSNVASKKTYNGINLMVLGWQPSESKVWGTFNQWKKLGGFVRKGEEGTSIIFWKMFDKKDKDGNIVLDKDGKPEVIRYLKYSKVFNAHQIEGIELEKYLPVKPEGNEFSPIEKAEQIVQNMPKRPQTIHSGNVACYSPSMDTVTMPTKEQFHNSESYYSVLFHEYSHSTGHKSRVGRDLEPTQFGSESYSKEELIAEISACFLCSNAGINTTFDNSAAYVKGWLSKLKNDKRLIVTASSAAKKSAKFILGESLEYKAEKAETEKAEA